MNLKITWLQCVYNIGSDDSRYTWITGNRCSHYGDIIMGAIASQITSLTIVYSTVYSDADQRKHQSSASLAFVRGIHRGPVNSPHKWPVTRKMFPFEDVIMGISDRLDETFVEVANETAGPYVLCDYIKNGSMLLVTVNCEQTILGRYVRLRRDEDAPDQYIINVCEVSVTGSLYKSKLCSSESIRCNIFSSSQFCF